MKSIHTFTVMEGLNLVAKIITSGEIDKPGVDVRMMIDNDADLGAVAEEFRIIAAVLEARQHNRDVAQSVLDEMASYEERSDELPF